jgi:hypothetical protein
MIETETDSTKGPSNISNICWTIHTASVDSDKPYFSFVMCIYPFRTTNKQWTDKLLLLHIYLFSNIWFSNILFSVMLIMWVIKYS